MTDALAEYPKTVVLTDGTHVVLRPTAPDDAGRLATLRASLPAEDRAAIEGAGDAAVVLAVAGENAVGAVALERSGAAGVVRVVLAPGYRGRRLGTWMLLDVVHLGATLGLAHLVAAARPQDAAYRAALRRLDFVEDDAGAWVKTLHAGWPDF